MVRPVPIPNTAVKHCMADGSGCIASARVGSRQSFKNPEVRLGVFAFYEGSRKAGRIQINAETQRRNTELPHTKAAKDAKGDSYTNFTDEHEFMEAGRCSSLKPWKGDVKVAAAERSDYPG